jgi:hypothetical protein
MVSALTCVISILFTFRAENPFYLRIFPFYHGSSIITEVIVYKYFSEEGKLHGLTSDIPYNIFTLIEFLTFSLLILSIVSTGRKAIVACILFFLYYFFQIAIKRNFDFPNNAALMLQNLSLIIPCLIYYNDIFSAFTIPNLSKEPSFWIVTGIMFYSIITTPLQFFFFYGRSLSDGYGILYTSSNGTAYILMYLLFIKAYTCRIGK